VAVSFVSVYLFRKLVVFRQAPQEAGPGKG